MVPVFLQQHVGSLGLSVVLHALVVALLTVSFAFSGPPAAAPPAVSIKAQVVDETQILAEMARLDLQEQAEERQRRQEAETARTEAAAEQKRLEDLREQREQAEQERQQQAKLEQQRRDEQARKTQQRKEAEARAARERQEQEKREKARLAELEKKRQAEEQRLARIKEEQRKAEEQRRKEEAARARAQREQELRESLALEEQRMQAENAGLLAQYKALIQQKVMRNWNRPPEAGPGINCEVFASQIPGGEVVGVRIGRCNADDVVRRSIETAVYRASPLPPPPDPSLFERNLVFDFKPE